MIFEDDQMTGSFDSLLQEAKEFLRILDDHDHVPMHIKEDISLQISSEDDKDRTLLSLDGPRGEC